MRPLILTGALAAVLPGPAVADNYPVSGRFAVGTFPSDEVIACAGRRVIRFFGAERTDSRGGVVRQEGEGRYRVADWFSNGQSATDKCFTTCWCSTKTTCKWISTSAARSDCSAAGRSSNFAQ